MDCESVCEFLQSDMYFIISIKRVTEVIPEVYQGIDDVENFVTVLLDNHDQLLQIWIPLKLLRLGQDGIAIFPKGIFNFVDTVNGNHVTFEFSWSTQRNNVSFVILPDFRFQKDSEGFISNICIYNSERYVSLIQNLFFKK